MRIGTSLRVALSVVIVAAIGGCKEKSTVQPTDCSQKTVSPPTVSVNASDGTATATVTAPAGCTWTASTSIPWVTVTSGASGTGPGTVVFAIRGNSGAARSGTATVADKTVTLLQEGAPAGCSYVISPAGYSMGSAGGNFVVQVTTGAGCPWSYDSGCSWLTVGPPLPAGAAAAARRAAVTAPPGRWRSRWPSVRPRDRRRAQGTATIAGQTLTVLQDGTGRPVCSYCAVAVECHLHAGGRRGSLTVTTGPIAAGRSIARRTRRTGFRALFSGRKVGSATVSYTVRPNMTFQSRTGRLLLYGTQPSLWPTHAVTQEAANLPLFRRADAGDLPAAGGTGTFIVSTQPGDCSWTASPDASWLDRPVGLSGSGPRTVTYRAVTSAGADRTGMAASGLTVGLHDPLRGDSERDGRGVAMIQSRLRSRRSTRWRGEVPFTAALTGAGVT